MEEQPAQHIKELQASEAHFRALFEATVDAIITIDEMGIILSGNPASEQLFGYRAEEMIGRNVSLLMPSPDREQHDQYLEHYRRTGVRKIIGIGRETVAQRKDGTTFPIRLAVSETRIEGRRIFIGQIHDLTNRKRAQEALRDSEERFRTLFETANDAIFLMKGDTFAECNSRTLEMFGCASKADLLHHTPMEFSPARQPDGRESQEKGWDYINRALAGLPQSFYWKHQRKDRTLFDAEVSLNKLELQGKTYLQAIVHDFTEHKTAEIRILRLSQLYAALSKCNQAIVHSESMEELMPIICRDVVEFGGLRMAWFGVIDEATGRVHPKAAFGSGTEYLEGIEISVNADDPTSRGPVGTAIRENEPSWFQDFQNDPRAAPWNERAARYGWEAVAALPLRMRGKPIGALAIYSNIGEAFDEEVRNLLVEMANEISFALDSFAHEAERKQAEEEVKTILRTAMDGFYIVDLEGGILDTNDSYCSMIGYSREELLKMSIKDVEAIESDEVIKSRIQEIMATGQVRFETKHRRKDGGIIVIEASCNFLPQEKKRLFCFMRDITERKQAEEALRESEVRFRTVVEQAGDGFEILDEEGRYLDVNRATCQQMGYSREELLTMRVTDIDPLNNLERFKATFPVPDAKPVTFETIHRRSDGSTFPVEVTHSALFIGNKIRMLSLVRDITERKRTEEALLKAKTDAEAANKAKDQFIAVLSHELRTPLTPILLSSSAIETEEGVPEGIRAELGVIRRNVELEMKLIDDLLDVTRISTGKIQLHQEIVDAHGCLRNALEICQSEITAKHLNLTLRLEANQPHVWADPTRLQQVFWNLLRNAVKFTPEGGQISIQSANIDNRLHMEFSDTGIGIEPDLLLRIFNAFEQAEQGKERRFGGLGLGLSISKALVELHHGSLTAFSKGTDKGATFTLEMETVPEVKAPPVTPNATPLQQQSDSKSVLLVEDHADTLRILARMLQKWGYTVRTADCVRSALEEATKEPFDLLVSDIGLPDGSGLVIMQEVKKLYGVRGIAISGFGAEEDIRQSRAAGFSEHLVKPVSIQDMHAALQRLVLKPA